MRQELVPNAKRTPLALYNRKTGNLGNFIRWLNCNPPVRHKKQIDINQWA